MKRIVSLVLCAALSVSLLLTLSACGGETLTLNVYNWGEYISDGSEDSLDTIAAFESWYQEEYGQKIRVNYDTYPSNEDMYAKLSSGAVSYDVIIPSDYMIARLSAEDMLLPAHIRKLLRTQGIRQRLIHRSISSAVLMRVLYEIGAGFTRRQSVSARQCSLNHCRCASQYCAALTACFRNV